MKEKAPPDHAKIGLASSSTAQDGVSRMMPKDEAALRMDKRFTSDSRVPLHAVFGLGDHKGPKPKGC